MLLRKKFMIFSAKFIIFHFQNIHNNKDEREDNKRICSYPQSTTSKSLTVNMTQLTKKMTLRKAINIARGS